MKRWLSQSEFYSEIAKEKTRKGEPLEYTVKTSEEMRERYNTYLKKRKNDTKEN